MVQRPSRCIPGRCFLQDKVVLHGLTNGGGTRAEIDTFHFFAIVSNGEPA